MRKNIYIIIGNGGMGKSTTVRALTGTYRGGWKSIELIDENDTRREEHFRVWPQSAQEGTYLTPQDVLNNINACNEQNILFTTKATNEADNANDYIQLISSQHTIVAIVSMGEYDNVLVPNGSLINVIPDPWERPTNGNASCIRKWWNWA